MASSPWIDISVSLRMGMVHWPGDAPFRIKRTKHLVRGDACTLSTLSMGAHTGTHMDAPCHFLKRGKSIDRIPLDATVGQARIIQIRDRKTITVSELRRYRIRRGERLLFKTVNSYRCWKTRTFVRDFVSLSTEAAYWLVRRRVRAVGVDYLSVGGYKQDGARVHKLLLGAGIAIIEGLNLSRVRSGTYELICLPLKISRGDGSPARVIVRPLK